MFSKAKPKSYKTAASVAPSILGTDLAITGDLVSEGEIQIDGKVNGDVRCTPAAENNSCRVSRPSSARRVILSLGAPKGREVRLLIASNCRRTRSVRAVDLANTKGPITCRYAPRR